MSLVALRPAKDTDRAFIRSSWLKSWQRAAPAMPDSVYWSDFGQSGLVDHLLNTYTTIVACPHNDEELIAGWCCYDVHVSPTVLHYLYVQQAFRADEFAVADALIQCLGPEKALFITHPHTFIRQAVEKRGVVVTVEDPFRTYGRKDKRT